MKRPPPSTALSAPARAPATKRKRMVWSAKYQVYNTGRKKRCRQRSSGHLYICPFLASYYLEALKGFACVVKPQQRSQRGAARREVVALLRESHDKPRTVT